MSGFLALLDDVAAIAKLAAAQIDDPTSALWPKKLKADRHRVTKSAPRHISSSVLGPQVRSLGGRGEPFDTG